MAQPARSPNQLGEDQAPEPGPPPAPLDVDGILDRSGEGRPRLVGRESAVRHDVRGAHGAVRGAHGHDDRIGLRVSGQPLALGDLIAGFGVGGRVGAEDLVVPDRGDLREVRLAGGADLDASGARAATVG